MSSVGLGFGAFNPNVVLARKPVNPYDKTTIVSIYPKEIISEFVTVFPRRYVIPAAPKDDFSLLVVEPASSWRFVGEDEPYLEFPINSFEVANSVVLKFVQGLLDSNGADMMPGLTCIPGEFTPKTIKNYISPEGKTFATILAELKTRQDNWFKKLIETADVLWSRSSGNPLSIPGDSRLAAELMGVEKAWMNDIKTFEMKNCPACGALVNPTYPVCGNCKAVINKEKAQELKLEFAK